MEQQKSKVVIAKKSRKKTLLIEFSVLLILIVVVVIANIIFLRANTVKAPETSQDNKSSKREIETKPVSEIINSNLSKIEKYDELMSSANTKYIASNFTAALEYYESALSVLDPVVDKQLIEDTQYAIIVFCRNNNLSECEKKYITIYGEEKFKAKAIEVEKERYKDAGD